MPRIASVITIAAVLVATSRPLAAQQRPARADSTRRDSTRIQPLTTVTVRVMADQRRLETVPWAVGVAGVRELRRAQPTVHLDEALGSIPGVFVGNRYNFATDSRIAIRGAGARANFGLRGVQVFLDGVPQTLADGQSQLTNIELGNIDRVEVLRGSTSSLFGNGSAGVLSFSNDMRAPTPFAQTVRVMSGSYGERKVQLRTVGRAGNAISALSLSRLTIDGFRQRSDAEARQLNAAVDYALGADSRLELRAQVADVPNALNPGALTVAEYALRRDSASAANIRRGADKRVRQDQLSASYHRGSAQQRTELVATGWYGTRDVRNALATQPPGTVTPATGIYSTIDRTFNGARLSARPRACRRRQCTGADGRRGPAAVPRPAREPPRHGRPSHRRHRHHHPRPGRDGAQPRAVRAGAVAGRLARARERRRTLRPPALQCARPVQGRRRHQWRRQQRCTHALRGQRPRGVTLTGWPAFAPYANVSTSFETPTTTELQVRPDRQGGFNPNLQPQRTLSTEVGARGAAGSLATWNVAAYHARVRNAIVQSRVVDGTAFFENAGRTRNAGVEAGASVRVGRIASLNAAYTWSDLTFVDYRQTTGTRVDTLDGKQLPGVPPQQLRIGVRSSAMRGFTIDADQTWTSALFADDLNTIRVPGWGSGVTNVRAAWTGAWHGYRVEPFAGVLNARNVAYVGAVTVNGAFGRVLEPSPLRNWYLGLDLGVAR